MSEVQCWKLDAFEAGGGAQREPGEQTRPGMSASLTRPAPARCAPACAPPATATARTPTRAAPSSRRPAARATRADRARDLSPPCSAKMPAHCPARGNAADSGCPSAIGSEEYASSIASTAAAFPGSEMSASTTAGIASSFGERIVVIGIRRIVGHAHTGGNPALRTIACAMRGNEASAGNPARRS